MPTVFSGSLKIRETPDIRRIKILTLWAKQDKIVLNFTQSQRSAPFAPSNLMSGNLMRYSGNNTKLSTPPNKTHLNGNVVYSVEEKHTPHTNYPRFEDEANGKDIHRLFGRNWKSIVFAVIGYLWLYSNYKLFVCLFCCGIVIWSHG